jgi:type IV secretory pathway VirB10-like protein
MDERRKIVIPIGAEPDSKSEQTFFDTQARKDARPVVPLSGTPTTGPAVPAARSRKLVFLVVFLVAALAAAGTAAGYVFLSKDRGQTEPQAAVQPVAGKTLATLPWTHTPEEPVSNENAEAAIDDEEKDAAEEARDDNRADESRARNDRAANEVDPKKANKKQKRGKTDRRNDDDQDNPVKRTQDELHRIREIFEGPPE